MGRSGPHSPFFSGARRNRAFSPDPSGGPLRRSVAALVGVLLASRNSDVGAGSAPIGLRRWPRESPRLRSRCSERPVPVFRAAQRVLGSAYAGLPSCEEGVRKCLWGSSKLRRGCSEAPVGVFGRPPSLSVAKEKPLLPRRPVRAARRFAASPCRQLAADADLRPLRTRVRIGRENQR